MHDIYTSWKQEPCLWLTSSKIFLNVLFTLKKSSGFCPYSREKRLAWRDAMRLCLVPCVEDISSEGGVMHPGEIMGDGDCGRACVDSGLSCLVRPASPPLWDATTGEEVNSMSNDGRSSGHIEWNNGVITVPWDTLGRISGLLHLEGHLFARSHTHCREGVWIEERTWMKAEAGRERVWVWSREGGESEKTCLGEWRMQCGDPWEMRLETQALLPIRELGSLRRW